MRYAKSKSRLVLAVSSEDVAGLVTSAVHLIVPRYSRKLYFLGESERGYQELERLAEEVEGFTIVRAGSEPSNLITSFRVLHRDSELIVVPGASARFAPAEWDRIVLELQNAVSSGDSAEKPIS